MATCVPPAVDHITTFIEGNVWLPIPLCPTYEQDGADDFKLWLPEDESLVQASEVLGLPLHMSIIPRAASFRPAHGVMLHVVPALESGIGVMTGAQSTMAFARGVSTRKRGCCAV